MSSRVPELSTHPELAAVVGHRPDRRERAEYLARPTAAGTEHLAGAGVATDGKEGW